MAFLSLSVEFFWNSFFCNSFVYLLARVLLSFFCNCFPVRTPSLPCFDFLQKKNCRAWEHAHPNDAPMTFDLFLVLPSLPDSFCLSLFLVEHYFILFFAENEHYCNDRFFQSRCFTFVFIFLYDSERSLL